MSSRRFVHLRLHSEFSVVDGIVRIDEAVKKAHVTLPKDIGTM